MKKDIYRKGIFLVVYRRVDNKTEYLLLKRKINWRGWEFPKGGIEKGETIKQTILRELKEEAGGLKLLKMKNHHKKGKWKYRRELKDHPCIKGQTYSLYSVRVGSGRVKFDKKEHSGYKWDNFNKAIEMLTWPNQLSCLRIVNQKIFAE